MTLVPVSLYVGVYAMQRFDAIARRERLENTMLAYDYPLLGAFWTILWLFLFPVWVNVHGGFVVGIGLLALYLLELALDRQPVRHRARDGR